MSVFSNVNVARQACARCIGRWRAIAFGLAFTFLSAAPLLAAPPTIGGCQVFPANNYWNTPIEQLPLHPSSTVWQNNMRTKSNTNSNPATLWPDWGNVLADNFGIPFIVAANPPPATITFDVPDESDANPYLIPANAPVEGGANSGGDMHVLAIDSVGCKLYELYSATQTSPTSWNAFSGAIFPLNSNALRPDSWTSADAAGFAVVPGLVRWEEVFAGEINHAIRFTAQNIWASNGAGSHVYLWPARHWSGTSPNANFPPMGARFRLKASFDISGYDARTQVILRAMKKYGLVLADGGSNWFISGMSDANFPDLVLNQIKSIVVSPVIAGSNPVAYDHKFEVVDTSLLIVNGNTNSAQAVQLPGAPTNLLATPGSGLATFTFTSPADGGAPIIAHAVTCNPGAKTASAVVSPITLTGLTNGVALTCAVTATNRTGTGAAPAAINVTPGAPATVPGAPTIGTPIAGDGRVAILFAPPLSDGGSPITSYTASCVNGGTFSASAAGSPITVTGLANNVSHTCTVTATNTVGTGAASASIAIMPSAIAPLTPIAVVSRKTHGAAGIFDLSIDTLVPITGAVSVEPRNIGAGHIIVFQFNVPVATTGNLTVAPLGTGAAVASCFEVMVTLANVPDNRRTTISLGNVNGTAVNVAASIGFLVGDANSTGSVNSSDISGVKARAGQATNAANFKFDVNASGTINPADVSAVKARSGLVLP